VLKCVEEKKWLSMILRAWKGSPWPERKLFSLEEEERIIKGVTEGGAVSNRDRTVLNIVFRDG